MNHPLHEEIGQFLSRVSLPANCRLFRAPECGGTHNLPLFCSLEKGNDSELCNVDALIVKNGKIKFILEIEESGLLPTKVGGKFLTSALSTHFIHEVLRNIPSPMDDEVLFVQVLNSQHLPAGTAKIRQGIKMGSGIASSLGEWSKIKSYKLIHFNGAADFQTRSSELDQLIQTACGADSHGQGSAVSLARLDSS